jgi:hypothetical protein
VKRVGVAVRCSEHPRREEIQHMPGLMGRATTIVKAKFSKVLDRAENPNETLDYSYE